ncbi:uncharacterized protein [Nicotiana sylvestris]|uniref:uncharacterized protein n=1 Tax=Nicotiana sylvestris TaxID=4096 RepID=UPI00388C5969
MITALVTTLHARTHGGGGKVGRCRPRGVGQSNGTQSRCYAFPARPEAVASDAVIIGTISICHRDASVLFYPWSTYSYVSSLFGPYLDVIHESLDVPIYVSTPVGNFVIVDRVYRSCEVIFCAYQTRADLILLNMVDFEVILGMDWLSLYRAILDCHAKTISFVMP